MKSESLAFRSLYNWEQDYLSNPPSLCLQNGTECGQGNVPVFAINASSPTDLQAGIKFAAEHNLKFSVKSTGHDFLGRSIAKVSLLLWTHYFRNVSFAESFEVDGKHLGSAVTVGSGVRLNEIYSRSREVGKFVVTGNTATVAAAGGYIQGAGHSAFSPAFGLAADNAHQFEIVLADGSFVTANRKSYSDLFWALRGGGAGSWGVITSATFQTFPTFNATLHRTVFLDPTNADAGAAVQLHAQHAFDWDDVRAGQYFHVSSGLGLQSNMLTVSTYFKDLNESQANASMKPLFDDVRVGGFEIIGETVTTATGNELLFSPDGMGGSQSILGSRLIPEKVYRRNVEGIGRTYTELLDAGVPQIAGNMIAGAENSKLSAAVHPKWGTAKMHLIIIGGWAVNATAADIEQAKQTLTNRWVPILVRLTGETDSGAYSNEADVREPNFQQTFYETNYARLRAVKRKYDPKSLFIVPTGVGSEEWDKQGICRK